MPREEHQRDQVLAAQAAGLRGSGCGSDGALVEASKLLGGVDNQRERVAVGLQLLVELDLELREAPVQLTEASRRRVVEAGTRKARVAMQLLDEEPLFVGEPGLLTAVEHRLDAREQLTIQRDGIFVGGQARPDLRFNLVDAGGRVARAQREEDRDSSLEELTRALESLDRVREGRGLRVRDDRVDLSKLFCHTGLERGEEMLLTHLSERRQLIGERAGGCERVLGIELHGLGHAFNPRRDHRRGTRIHLPRTAKAR